MLRQSMQKFNQYMMVPMWRLGLGKLINMWPEGIGQIMVLVHRGRKSGRVYQTPVNYILLNGNAYCAVGFGQTSDWYRNIMANPQVEIWLPDGWWAGEASDVTNDAELDAPAMLRAILVASGYAGPLFGMDPNTMSDEQLEEMVKTYRIVRITRTEARTGPGGPDEFSWIWPLVAMALGMMFLLRPRKRARKKG